MAIPIRIKVEGLERIRQKLRGHALYAGPFRHALDELGKRGAESGRSAGPVLTGKLRSQITHRLLGGAVPTGAVIRAYAANKGYPYPRLLEYSAKHHHLGWLRSALKPVLAGAGAVMARAAHEIEAIWGSR